VILIIGYDTGSISGVVYVSSSSTLIFDRSSDSTDPGVIYGSGNVTKSAQGL